ncbi:MAG: GlxA family transcriptional regulator [Methyloligella sp. ZOD6]
MRIVILAADSSLPSAFIGLMDVLTLAQWALAEQGFDNFDLVSASMDGKPVKDRRGSEICVDTSLDQIKSCEAVVIPGFIPNSDRRPPKMEELAPVASWVRARHAYGALICGSCSGVFLVAEAGLLDGRRCTTTWWLHDELKRRYPSTEPLWASPLIEQDRIATAGGPLSWIDLALHTLRRLCGAEAARVAADFAVVDSAPSVSTAYSPIGHLSRGGSLLLEAERAVRHAGSSSIRTRELARHLAISERTLHRKLSEATGESPKRFIDRVRIETARVLLASDRRSIKEISASVGYQDESSFRRSFKRFVGTTPAAYRSRMHDRQAKAVRSAEPR